MIDNISIPIPFSVPASFEAEIPLAIINTTDPVTTPEIPFNLDLDKEIKEKYPSLSINNLKSVKLDRFNIQYISSDNGFKLDVIKNANLYIKTPSSEIKLIATATNNTNETTLNFTPVADLELSDYLKTKENSLILEIQGSKVAADVMKVKFDSSFKLQVGL